MALVGKLEDLQLAELFHLLSLFRKTGKLTLTSDRATGSFFFKNGKICHASNGCPGPALGELLVRRSMISPAQLETALHHQVESPEWRRLGTVLVELGMVAREDLDALLRERLQAVTEEFLQLESGFFSFKPQEPRRTEPVPTPAEDLDLGDGINTDGFILDLLTRLDEVHRPTDGGASGEPRYERRPTEAPPSSDLGTLLDYLIDGATIADLEEVGPGRFEGTDEIGDLCSLMTEIQLRSPSYTGEIALMILRYASNLVNRGALFHVGAEAITAIGQFGLGDRERATAAVEAQLRSFSVPRDQPSIFLEIAEMMHTYRGPLKPSPWNDELARRLGGPRPTEVVAIPIVVDGMMAAVFYGDNVPKQDAIGSVKGLELLMIEAGLAMERRLLQAKLRRVEEQLRTFDRATVREDGA